MVVGTTDDMVDDLAWRYALNPGQTRVIPNYVLADGMVVPSDGRDKSTVLYAGQLVARKRVDVLIEAVASDELRDRVKLKIVGEGREEPRLRELARKLGASVEFGARVPHRELLTLMESCTIYAQASELEGHPKTVLEAMAAGAPVLVAASPGLAEVIDHGSSGLRVQPTAEAFALAINDLLQDPEWRDLLGATAARIVRARFGLPTVLREEIEVHRVALSRGAGNNSQTRPLRKTA
jgi:glycosyltransferase involved in cell wall biosynthesis